MSCSLTISSSAPWPLVLKLKTSATPGNLTFSPSPNLHVLDAPFSLLSGSPQRHS